MAKWIVNLCLNGWIVLLRGFLRGVLLFMFYKKFAAVVLSAVLVGVVPSVVFADVDDVSAVSDGDVEELSIEDDFSDGADSISAFASALADKTVSEVQGYQEAKAELPRVAVAQCSASEKKSVADIEAGDLVFYGEGCIDHVALYIGDGKIVHASTAATGIKVSDYDYRAPAAVGSFVE